MRQSRSGACESGSISQWIPESGGRPEHHVRSMGDAARSLVVSSRELKDAQQCLDLSTPLKWRPPVL